MRALMRLQAVQSLTAKLHGALLVPKRTADAIHQGGPTAKYFPAQQSLRNACPDFRFQGAPARRHSRWRGWPRSWRLSRHFGFDAAPTDKILRLTLKVSVYQSNDSVRGDDHENHQQETDNQEIDRRRDCDGCNLLK